MPPMAAIPSRRCVRTSIWQRRCLSPHSSGLAVSAADDADGDDLLRRADVALYAAKADGGDRVRVFEPEMEERQNQRRWLERELRLASGTENCVAGSSIRPETATV